MPKSSGIPLTPLRDPAAETSVHYLPMGDVSKLAEIIKARLRNVCEHIRERGREQARLTAYQRNESYPEPAGSEITRILRAIQAEENLALKEIVHVLDDIRAYCLAAGKSTSEMRVIDKFRAIHAARAIASGPPGGPPGSTCHYVSVSRHPAPGKPAYFHDVRFFIGLNAQVHQVFELILDLLQFVAIFLRYHTDLDLEGFSPGIQHSLVGRFTDMLFWQQVAERHFQPATPRLVSISQPPSPSSSADVLRKEVSDRLQEVAFCREEREHLRSRLTKYTGRNLMDASNEDAKRALKRIHHFDTTTLQELVHLRDIVGKWFEKQDRRSELDVVEGFLPYRIAANLANVCKHGIRGKGRECAVVDWEVLCYARKGESPTPDDPLLDVSDLVNFNGHLYPLPELIEDVSQLWEMFLRHHSELKTTEFLRRIGAIHKLKEGLVIYTFTLPSGLDTWAQEQAEQRKKLDLQ